MKRIYQAKQLIYLLLIATITFIAACTGPLVASPPANTSAPAEQPATSPTDTPQSEVAEPETIVLMSHDSFAVSDEVVQAFEAANNAKIEFLRAGDAGASLNQAILSKENPLADVFFGVDNTFFSRAVESDIFEPYSSPLLENVDDALKLDADNRLLPVDYGDVCLNYDIAWFKDEGLPPPASLKDLVKPEYAGLTVVENPATSSLGRSR